GRDTRWAIASLRRIEAEARLHRGELEPALSSAKAAMELVAEGSADWFAAAGHFASACARLRQRERVVELGEKVLQHHRRDAPPTQIMASARITEILMGDGCVLADALSDRLRE